MPSLIQQAESEDWPYRTFLHHLASYEQNRREEIQIEKRLMAAFLFYKTIDGFQVDEQQSLARDSQTRMKRIRGANLVIFDDLMIMAMDTREANLFFHLINDLYDKASVILTSNKGPNEWKNY